jgi:hypothetical protein
MRSVSVNYASLIPLYQYFMSGARRLDMGILMGTNLYSGGGAISPTQYRQICRNNQKKPTQCHDF